MKKRNPVWEFLWRSVIYGLGSMMILSLVLNIFSFTVFTEATIPQTLYWEEEPLEFLVSHFGYTPEYAFPLFPAVYIPTIPLAIQFLWQCASCILAAAGVLLTMRVIRSETLSFGLRLVLAPIATLAGALSLMLQIRFYLSDLLTWLMPTLFAGVAMMCVFLYYRTQLLHLRELNEQLRVADPHSDSERMNKELRPTIQYSYYRGMYTTVSDVSSRFTFVVLILVVVIFLITILGSSVADVAYY